MHPLLNETAHRPWPLPDEPWVMFQTWRDLLFAHWPVAPKALRRVVPEPIPIDMFDGTAWLGIVPFEVTGLRTRGTPPLPWVSHFPELNVRTYTTLGGKPGIWFFTLDAARVLAVVGARATYRLPYHHARMRIERSGGGIRYRSARPRAQLQVEYEPAGPAHAPAAGTLEHFLTERYCLYTLAGARVRRAEIHHSPWPLQPATARIETNTMAPVTLPEHAPLLHFARRQDVLIWRLRAA